MNRPIRWYDYLTINSYWFGLTALSQTMTPLVLPLLVQQFVGTATQGAAYGQLRLWTLMVAVLMQALMGMVSDHSTSRFGRRRPFVLVGTLGVILVVVMVGFSAGLEGMTGYWTLFGLIILMMVFANTAHGAQQGLIPDLVPPEQHGRMSGVKAILEVPLPVIIVSLVIGRLVAAGNLWAALLVLIGLLIFVTIVTMFAPETPRERSPFPITWGPFIRLALMTAAFTAVILFIGQIVRWVGGGLDVLSAVPQLVLYGLLGLLAMATAVFVGVTASIRIGLGQVHSPTNRAFTWWVISRLSFLVGSTSIASFLIYFLQDRFNYAREEAAAPAATLMMFVGVFILVAAFPSGWLSDRFGRKPVLIVGGIIAALGVLVVVNAPSMPFVYAGGVLIGVATGQFYAVNWALGTDLVPREQAGRYLGLSNLAGAGAGAIGAYIGGPVADMINANVTEMPGMGYLVLFLIYAVMFIVSVLTLRGIRKPAETS